MKNGTEQPNRGTGMNLKVLEFVSKGRERVWFKIGGAAAISGIANSAVVIIVNAAAKNYSQLNFKYLVLFALCITIYIITFKFSFSRSTYLARDIVAQTRLRIADKLRRASLLSFEGMGQGRIYTTLSENTEIIFEASRLITATASAVVMLMLTFGYLAVISRMALWMSIIIIFCAVFVYISNQEVIKRYLTTATQKEAEFYTSLNHFLHGFIEIKMNRAKSDDIFNNYLKKFALSEKDFKIKAEAKLLTNQIFAQTFWYFLVASIVFLLPQLTKISSNEIMSSITVVMFILGPIGMIVGSIPLIVKGNLAVDKLQGLENELDKVDDLKATSERNPFAPPAVFAQIRLDDAGFSYSDPGDLGSFSIGPIDLKINTGEIVFIIGGNGSGKTTLLKVMAGLYYPKSGAIFMNNRIVDKTNYAHYRNEMAAIFTEFHLFDRLYGVKDVDLDRVDEMFRIMELMDKTDYVDGEFTNLNLSTGQRRRLALIIALMEDKPVIIIDELAADQDPEFRKYFYEVLLKDLKAQGKTIIATSHDDRYFHVADRVVKMEYGKIVKEK
ncbi:MAG: cyclic peptide export ABC transporter [Desulfobacterales bacterium]|nr:cyclic peptide export ABC transporter [Desulfobacterales bacterium]MDP6808739.1 cyclic peptide export ABC transporter [Desulfobacterales bacterium]